jgi:hypothetical protein
LILVLGVGVLTILLRNWSGFPPDRLKVLALLTGFLALAAWLAVGSARRCSGEVVNVDTDTYWLLAGWTLSSVLVVGLMSLFAFRCLNLGAENWVGLLTYSGLRGAKTLERVVKRIFNQLKRKIEAVTATSGSDND